jgi:hypothetical protein
MNQKPKIDNFWLIPCIRFHFFITLFGISTIVLRFSRCAGDAIDKLSLSIEYARTITLDQPQKKNKDVSSTRETIAKNGKKNPDPSEER